MEGEASCKAGGCLPGSAPGSRSRRVAGRSCSLSPPAAAQQAQVFAPGGEATTKEAPKQSSLGERPCLEQSVEMFIAEGIVKGSGDCGYTTKRRLTA